MVLYLDSLSSKVIYSFSNNTFNLKLVEYTNLHFLLLKESH